MKPLNPKEVGARKIENIPNYVIEAFNNMITKKWNTSKEASFTQDDVMDEALRLAQKQGIIATSQQIFANKWFDVEESFRQEGWIVNYDKPGYCESYNATFSFSIGK